MAESSGELTLVVDHDLDLSVLHDTNTRVGCSKIDTNDGAGDSVAVLGEGLLVLSASCLREHQASDKDHEKVESNAPCGALAGAPQAARHCGCAVCVSEPLCGFNGRRCARGARLEKLAA